MPLTLDMKPRWMDMLQTILRRYVPEAEVWAYGSRVRGGGCDSSDLDIVLRSPDDLTKQQMNLGRLREALSESNIPILVDTLDWARIPASFRDEISKAYVVIQKAGSVPPSGAPASLPARIIDGLMPALIR